MEKENKSDLKAMANIPFEIEIKGKKYAVKNASIGAYALVAPKVKKIWKMSGFDPRSYGEKEISAEKLQKDMLTAIYKLFMSEATEEVFKLGSEIICIILNNKPLSSETLDPSPEDIMWGMEIQEILKILFKLLEMSDLTAFFLLTARLAQANDIEGELNG